MYLHAHKNGVVVGAPSTTQSRRGLLRLAGAGAFVVVAGNRFASRARAQSVFQGGIRVLHAAPDLGKVEVAFNDEEVLDEFDYGQASGWIGLDPGLVRVTIRRDRLFINDVVFDSPFAVVADERVNLIISDPLLLPAPVDRAPLPEGFARVRVLHASIDTPQVDVILETGNVAIAALAYGQQSLPVEISVGSYDIEFRAHETGDLLVEAVGSVLEPGTVYDMVVHGIPGDAETPLTVTMLTDLVRVVPLMATPEATPIG
jgi:hypothetical protein